MQVRGQKAPGGGCKLVRALLAVAVAATSLVGQGCSVLISAMETSATSSAGMRCVTTSECEVGQLCVPDDSGTSALICVAQVGTEGGLATSDDGGADSTVDANPDVAVGSDAVTATSSDAGADASTEAAAAFDALSSEAEASADVTVLDAGCGDAGPDSSPGDACCTEETGPGPATGACGTPPRACSDGGCASGVVMFGGAGLSSLLSDTWIWDGVQWTEVSLDAGPSARYGAGAVTDCDGVFLYGGKVSADVYSPEQWVWINGAWVQLPTPDADAGPGGRADFPFAKINSTTTVIFGGEDGISSALQDTWIWNDTSWGCWSCQPEVHSPPSLHEAASGAVGGTFVVFGGISDLGPGGTKLQGRTWLWNGVDWGDVTPISGGPTPRYQVASASLTVNGVDTLVVFGGSDGTNTLDETWVWNGLVWTQAFPGTTPPARTRGSAATLGNRVVLFGGYGPDGALLDNVTYTWDGSDWYAESSASSPQPPARASASMAAMPP